jgi:flagellar biosynthesis anti-sigma factor FlgM
MRIGINTPDMQSISAEQAKKSPAAATTNQSEPARVADETSFSQDKVTLSALATQALGQPEVRQGLVDSLRQGISSGQYQVDPNQIADAILGR